MAGAANGCGPLGVPGADNCFLWIEDFARAQKLADRQLGTRWPQELARLLYQANPALRRLLPTVRIEPYWSAEQSEWATDVAFRSAQALGARYAALVQHAITSFQSRDVMHFLGRRSYQGGSLPPSAARWSATWWPGPKACA